LNDLLVLILDGVLKIATKKPLLCVLHLIGTPHSSTDLMSMHRKLLHKHIAKLRADRRSPQEHTQHRMKQAASERDASSEALAEVARNWPQRVSHVQSKATIVHDFHSATYIQALKSFACASCAERVLHDKKYNRNVLDINLDILRNSPAMDPDAPTTIPPSRIQMAPHQCWVEADLVQIVAGERLPSEGPAPASLLPLAMCLQVSFVQFLTPPSVHFPDRLTNENSPSIWVALSPSGLPTLSSHTGTGISV